MLEGVRACGKPRTALEAAGSSVLMDDPAARALNDLAPGLIITGTGLVLPWTMARSRAGSTGCARSRVLVRKSCPAAAHRIGRSDVLSGASSPR